MGRRAGTTVGAADTDARTIPIGSLWQVAAEHGGYPPAVLGAGVSDDPGDSDRIRETDPALWRRIGVLVRAERTLELRRTEIGTEAAGPPRSGRAVVACVADGHAVAVARATDAMNCTITVATWPATAQLLTWLGRAHPAPVETLRRPTTELTGAGPDPDLFHRATAITEIALTVADRVVPAALVIIDRPDGRIAAAPDRGADGRWWTTIGPGTPGRIGAAITALAGN